MKRSTAPTGGSTCRICWRVTTARMGGGQPRRNGHAVKVVGNTETKLAAETVVDGEKARPTANQAGPNEREATTTAAPAAVTITNQSITARCKISARYSVPLPRSLQLVGVLPLHTITHPRVNHLGGIRMPRLVLRPVVLLLLVTEGGFNDRGIMI